MNSFFDSSMFIVPPLRSAGKSRRRAEKRISHRTDGRRGPAGGVGPGSTGGLGRRRGVGQNGFRRGGNIVMRPGQSIEVDQLDTVGHAYGCFGLDGFKLASSRLLRSARAVFPGAPIKRYRNCHISLSLDYPPGKQFHPILPVQLLSIPSEISIQNSVCCLASRIVAGGAISLRSLTDFGRSCQLLFGIERQFCDEICFNFRTNLTPVNPNGMVSRYSNSFFLYGNNIPSNGIDDGKNICGYGFAEDMFSSRKIHFDNIFYEKVSAVKTGSTVLPEPYISVCAGLDLCGLKAGRKTELCIVDASSPRIEEQPDRCYMEYKSTGTAELFPGQISIVTSSDDFKIQAVETSVKTGIIHTGTEIMSEREEIDTGDCLLFPDCLDSYDSNCLDQTEAENVVNFPDGGSVCETEGAENIQLSNSETSKRKNMSIAAEGVSDKIESEDVSYEKENLTEFVSGVTLASNSELDEKRAEYIKYEEEYLSDEFGFSDSSLDGKKVKRDGYKNFYMHLQMFAQEENRKNAVKKQRNKREKGVVVHFFKIKGGF